MLGFNKSRTPTFEEWLNENGYYYIKTKDNRPCFKSKLTIKLKDKYLMETGKNKNYFKMVFR